MRLLLAGLLTLVLTGTVVSDDPGPDLALIAGVGPRGQGTVEARQARDRLSRRGPEVLPPLLLAMDTPDPVAANWYRTIYEDIVARELASQSPAWPLEFLKEYIRDTRRKGRPRRLVLGLLERLEPGFTAQWLPERLEDPEFRYEAVALTLATGERALRENKDVEARNAYRKAFDAARDSAQVTSAAAKLKSLGEPADPVKHLGLVTQWWMIGPFDAPQKTGFAAVFEPERRVDLTARYRGQAGEIVWKQHRETSPLGQVDLNAVLGTTREAVGYAWTELEVPRDQAAQLRCGADDNCSVWLNGEKVFAREQWLNGTRFDRFIAPIRLNAGRNTLLVKVCQGPQHKDPEVPNNWSLQLRLCDDDGRGIEFTPTVR